MTPNCINYYVVCVRSQVAYTTLEILVLRWPTLERLMLALLVLVVLLLPCCRISNCRYQVEVGAVRRSLAELQDQNQASEVIVKTRQAA